MTRVQLFDWSWNEPTFYWSLLAIWVALGAASFVALLLTPAPYGRFARSGWGPRLNPKLGWILMEGPAAVVFFLFFVASGRTDPMSIVFLLLWLTHYVYRGYVYPLRRRGGSGVPLFVVLSAFAFNVTNGYLQSRYLFHFAPPYPVRWSAGPWFLVGIALFAAGWLAVVWTDNALRQLRGRDDGQGYTIPQGGLFRWVSCPNYLGEIIEWTGWALLTLSPAGAAFAFWTVANLLPRALAHQRWYRTHFADYPPDRKALIPYLL
ncbi:MAG TPA: 3-oxo-5-alpha-steroid 4-dehydrogenase [Planctomycetaceae bacterium]|nr:3-oxo-5-alpha-steroid 4-dehydrogenase [Planctomycetaceae bacterium]